MFTLIFCYIPGNSNKALQIAVRSAAVAQNSAHACVGNIKFRRQNYAEALLASRMLVRGKIAAEGKRTVWVVRDNGGREAEGGRVMRRGVG